jgi:hypothetical protein
MYELAFVNVDRVVVHDVDVPVEIRCAKDMVKDRMEDLISNGGMQCTYAFRGSSEEDPRATYLGRCTRYTYWAFGINLKTACVYVAHAMRSTYNAQGCVGESFAGRS